MRASQLTTQYIQALLFFFLGIRALIAWTREQDRRSGHLALATGLFGISSLLGAVSATIWDTAAGEQAPRALSILQSLVLFTSIYGFMLFLSNFIRYPAAVHAILIVATIGNIVLAALVRPDFRVDPQRGLVPIPGVSNPIPYRTYLAYVLVYLAVAFGLLALAFVVYGLRTGGLARFRMLAIGSGFFLLFVAIGLIPRILFGNPTAATVRTIGDVVRYIALASAPMLFVGFTPPKFLARRFAPTGRATAAS